ncbi:hypothetical protein [Arachidicoccus terrestris]|uniref:hypothetical protein n=1 Tax=Arachidicoccus terrestris TaxID=2875539 RepID=UPI001CC44C68|nr:hypothetical protein [Arachidicoccus terrestris]UAY56637.1 hypothetical protein K9M52_06460 [Arachidicoccus terrestris]
MKVLLYAVFLLFAVSGRGQTRHQLYIDSVSKGISQYIDSHKELLDSAEFIEYIKKLAFQFQGATDTLTLAQKRELPMEVMLRILHYNIYLTEKLYTAVPKNKYYAHGTSQPPSSISREDCASFWQYHKFTYHDSDSTLVHLTLDENYWIDSMADGSFSKLTVDKFNDQTFQICFIESNNNFKRLASIPGDIYCYQILEKTDHSFKLSTHILGKSSYDIFELNY